MKRQPQRKIRSTRYPIYKSQPLSRHKPLFFVEEKSSSYIELHGHSRYGLRRAIEILGLEEGSEVLLPSYLCREAVEVFQEKHIDIEFYQVENDLDPRIPDLVEKINEKTAAILVVNQFGFQPNNFEQVEKIADEYDLFLIDDCAHSALSTKKGKILGSFGDIGITGLYKSLPLTDGSVLHVGKEIDVDLEGIDTKFKPRDILKIMGEILSRIEPYHPVAVQKIREEFGGNTRRHKGDQKMSSISFLRATTLNVEDLKADRREKFQKWKDIFPPKKKLEKGVYPLCYPTFVEQPSKTKSILEKEGLYGVQTWNDLLADEVTGNPEFKNANKYIKHFIGLPVHSGTRIETEYLKEAFSRDRIT